MLLIINRINYFFYHIQFKIKKSRRRENHRMTYFGGRATGNAECGMGNGECRMGNAEYGMECGKGKLKFKPT